MRFLCFGLIQPSRLSAVATWASILRKALAHSLSSPHPRVWIAFNSLTIYWRIDSVPASQLVTDVSLQCAMRFDCYLY